MTYTRTFNDKPFDLDKERPWLKEDGIGRVYIDGALRRETPFKDGEEHGTEKWFSKDGSLDEAYEYYYGKDLSWWKW